jgi:hypothetical protein
MVRIDNLQGRRRVWANLIDRCISNVDGICMVGKGILIAVTAGDIVNMLLQFQGRN